MRFITKSVVFVAVLAGQLARASEEQLSEVTTLSAAEAPSQISTSFAPAEPYSAAEVGASLLRITSETLVGGLGTIGGGLLGFAIGSWGTRDPIRPIGGTVIGTILGSSAGTSLGGGLVGGTGHLGYTFAGAVVGGLASMLLFPTGSSQLVIGALVTFPLIGAIIGYETSQAPRAKPSDKDSLRFTPTISLTRDGKGATTGIAGTF